MLSLEFVKEHLNCIEKDKFLDKRFTKRFIDYLPTTEWEDYGFAYIGKDEYIPKEWTEENILDELKGNLEFTIEKALGHRGISASLMYDVLKSWCIVLENGLEETEYGWYGDKLIKAIDEYYNFGLYNADDFIESRIDHVRSVIAVSLDENDYKICESFNDGFSIDLNGMGFAKITFSKLEEGENGIHKGNNTKNNA